MVIPTVPLVEAIMAELAPFLGRQRRAMARRWCDHAISMTHLHVLMLIGTEGPMPMSRLAELLDVALPNATGIVSRMEERGLVERAHDDHDRRMVRVRMAPEGQAVVEEMEFVRRQYLARIIEQMTPHQQQNLLRAARDLRAAAERVDAAGEAAGEPPAA